MEETTQKQKAELLKQLHHQDNILVLPNIWDVAGARLLEECSYGAIATASASIARANGFMDGENISFDRVLAILSQIVASTHLPVTADIESGYANNLDELEKNIHRLLDTGIVGINIEDSDPRTKQIIPLEFQVERIRHIRQVAVSRDVPLFINARTDVYLFPGNLTPEEQLSLAVEKSGDFASAGADCLYPVRMRSESHIRTFVKELNMPVNILAAPDVPDLNVLQDIGVARVSFGPNFQKAVLLAMKSMLEKVQSQGSHLLTTEMLK
jgi:2-methylisocitrate lyase-like PEP mutase family enzyme